MKKFILILLLICTPAIFPYNAEIDNLNRLFYSIENRDNNKTEIFNAIKKLEALNGTKIEKQTYKNVAVVLRVRINEDNKKENKKLLESRLLENEPQLSSTDINYMTSLADLMVATMPYVGLSTIIELGGSAEELYDKSLAVDKNNFQSLFGKATSTGFKPGFVGGGVKKAMPFFKRAVTNAKKDYEKYLAYIWISQAYLNLKDKDNYNIYFNKAVSIFPNGEFTKKVKELNRKNKSIFK